MRTGPDAALLTGLTVISVLGLAVDSVVIVVALIYLTTGKRVQWMFRRPNPRAAASSRLCAALGGWILLAVLVATRGAPLPLLISFPVFFVLVGLSVFFGRKSQRPTAQP